MEVRNEGRRPMGAIGPDARRALWSSLAGSTVEWYEFFIYGLASALVFREVFFPQFDTVAGTLLSLSTFAVAFIARPLGASIFGHFGDRIGRKSTLIITLTMMGTATLLIGLLPPYSAVGVWAPILLIILRFIQGLSLGGEYTGAVLMCVEHAGPKRRGLFGSVVNTGLGLGLIAGNLVFIAASQISGPSFLTWGWRIPFVVSAVLVIIGLLIRLRVAESPEFERVKSSSNGPRRTPLFETFRSEWKTVVLVSLSYMAAGVAFYMVSVYSLTYGRNQLGLSSNVMLTLVLVTAGFIVVAMPFFGWVSDRVDRRTISVVSALGMAVVPFVWFTLLDSRSFWPMLLGYLILFLPFSANYGVMPTYFSLSFPSHIRYTGMALGYTIGTVISAAVAPMIATYLYAETNSSTAIAWYMSITAILSAAAALFLRERTGRSARSDQIDTSAEPKNGPQPAIAE